MAARLPVWRQAKIIGARHLSDDRLEESVWNGATRRIRRGEEAGRQDRPFNPAPDRETECEQRQYIPRGRRRALEETRSPHGPERRLSANAHNRWRRFPARLLFVGFLDLFAAPFFF